MAWATPFKLGLLVVLTFVASVLLTLSFPQLWWAAYARMYAFEDTDLGFSDKTVDHLIASAITAAEKEHRSGGRSQFAPLASQEEEEKGRSTSQEGTGAENAVKTLQPEKNKEEGKRDSETSSFSLAASLLDAEATEARARLERMRASAQRRLDGSYDSTTELNEEKLKKIAKHNRVMVTWANLHYLEFVMNWVEHLEAVGVTNYIVGAMDDEMLKELQKRKVPTFSMQSGLKTTDFGWGTTTFHMMGREKIGLIGKVTSLGFDLLLSDVDTVFLRDPNPFIDKYPDADVLTSSDHLTNTNDGDGGLEHYHRAGSSANIGIMYFSHRAHKLGLEWMKRLEADDKLWDQTAFNDIMRQGYRYNADEAREDRLFYGWDKQFLFGVLPISLFCSGHTFFVQDMARIELGEQPYVVHATFQYAGTPGKRHRFRERLLWDDPPEYFARTNGFLALDVDLPDELLNGPDAFSVEGHFKLVHHQLAQIRDAWAVARAIGRALILPPIYVQFDRLWYPIPEGRVAGVKYHENTYFLAPADHLFNFEHAQFGSNFEWREYSFLQNPRLPPEYLQRKRMVRFGGKKVATSDVLVEPNLSVEAVAAVLNNHVDVEILHLESGNALGSFADEEEGKRFEKMFRWAPGIWCCVMPPGGKGPGHIQYDAYWDKIPHVDKFDRSWTEPWTPSKLGP